MKRLIRALLGFLALMPRGMLQATGAMTGVLHHLLGTRAARVTRANLALCLPEADTDLAKKSLIETGKCLFETPAVWLGDLARLDTWIADVRGEQVLHDRVAADEGLLVLLPHMGNWELFNVFIRRYCVMTALYQPPRMQVMHDVMNEVRARYGNRMVPATPQGLRALFKALGSGETVVVLPDQVPASGVYAPFFGHQALTDELTGRLLAKTGAKALGVSLLRRDDGRFDAHVDLPPDDIYAGGERSAHAVNRLVETMAMRSPAQYQWEYKRFRERPVGEPKIYRFDKPPGIH